MRAIGESRPELQAHLWTAMQLARGEIIVAIKERSRVMAEEQAEAEEIRAMNARAVETPIWGQF